MLLLGLNATTLSLVSTESAVPLRTPRELGECAAMREATAMLGSSGHSFAQAFLSPLRFYFFSVASSVLVGIWDDETFFGWVS